MATLNDIHLERGLPASIEAERSILGAILLDNGLYEPGRPAQARRLLARRAPPHLRPHADLQTMGAPST